MTFINHHQVAIEDKPIQTENTEKEPPEKTVNILSNMEE